MPNAKRRVTSHLIHVIFFFYNTKSLFRNGGHRPIIQNSHNTILTMSGKLEISYLSYFIRLGKILFKLVSWKSVFMVLTHNKSSTRVAR